MKQPLVTLDECRIIEQALNIMSMSNGVQTEDREKAIRLKNRLTSKIEIVPNQIKEFRYELEQNIKRETENKIALYKEREELEQNDSLTDEEYTSKIVEVESSIKLLEKKLTALRSINNMTYNTCCDYGKLESLRADNGLSSDYWKTLYDLLDDYLTLPQASQYLAISADIIRTWESERECEYGPVNIIRYNGYLLINKHDCDKINIKNGRETKEIRGNF